MRSQIVVIIGICGLSLASSAHVIEESSVKYPQSGFIDWISSILNPQNNATTSITITTTKRPQQRECTECTCGMINTFRRIVGGQETEVHQYPWMAMLLTNNNFYCGASLINDLYVATAAHCVAGFNKRYITVRLLEHNRRNSSANIITRRVNRIDRHLGYNSLLIDNDIALIRLSEPVKMDQLLRPVCLPAEGNDFAGDVGIVTGWGAIAETGPIANALQEVSVPIWTQEECRRSNYGALRITDNMICAGYEEGNKDSCQGDSGGPLHVMNNDTMEHQLVGIVSWGEGCARPRSPGVYTRVNRYLKWIAERTRDACYCAPTKH